MLLKDVFFLILKSFLGKILPKGQIKGNPKQITFEAFLEIDYDLAMNDDKYFKLVELSKIWTNNCYIIIFVAAFG